MLKQENRFHSRNGVKAVLFKGAHKSVGPFKVSILPVRKPGDSPVAAVVVSKKVVKSAARRNRIRRRVFELIRKNWLDINPSGESYQTVVMCFDAELQDMPIEQMEVSLTSAIKHAKERLKR